MKTNYKNELDSLLDLNEHNQNNVRISELMELIDLCNRVAGFELLNLEQQAHIKKVNVAHLSYGSGYEMIEAWIDENNVTCVRCKNGDWYHYYDDETWG